MLARLFDEPPSFLERDRPELLVHVIESRLQGSPPDAIANCLGDP
jgi:hypothetical protein